MIPATCRGSQYTRGNQLGLRGSSRSTRLANHCNVLGRSGVVAIGDHARSLARLGHMPAPAGNACLPHGRLEGWRSGQTSDIRLFPVVNGQNCRRNMCHSARGQSAGSEPGDLLNADTGRIDDDAIAGADLGLTEFYLSNESSATCQNTNPAIIQLETTAVEIAVELCASSNRLLTETLPIGNVLEDDRSARLVDHGYVWL